MLNGHPDLHEKFEKSKAFMQAQMAHGAGA